MADGVATVAAAAADAEGAEGAEAEEMENEAEVELEEAAVAEEGAAEAEVAALTAQEDIMKFMQDAEEDDDSDFVLVGCPAGVAAGDLILVTAPDGREVEAEV
jgi:hypothetical protein